jgi:phosphoglycolate phosphatase-like HAD superfamily hydrolase
MRLLLFDIDQTLIYTAGAGMRCLRRAVAEVTGLHLEFAALPDGKTDPLILEEMLAQAGLSPTEYEHEIWRRYEQYLGEELSRADERRTVKPGVRPLLAALSEDSRACLGLLTGNLEVTARVKLAAFALAEYFPVGAFGSDAADRNQLGPIALERARRHWGVPFEAAETWIIGDTERDVRAAHAFGGRALAVATGRATVDELRASGAETVLADLADTARVMEVLLGL